LLPWAVGALWRTRREAARRAAEERAREEAEAERRRTYEERLRMAREIHDVVGHGLSVITMQAGVALHVIDRRPEQARLALEAIRDTSKHALDDLRGTLAVFRKDTAPVEGP